VDLVKVINNTRFGKIIFKLLKQKILLEMIIAASSNLLQPQRPPWFAAAPIKSSNCILLFTEAFL
jgi:hypothetical protein